MKLDVKLSRHPNFLETFICIANPRAILKGVGISDQKQLTCSKNRLITGTKMDENDALGRGCFKTFLCTAVPSQCY